MLGRFSNRPVEIRKLLKPQSLLQMGLIEARLHVAILWAIE